MSYITVRPQLAGVSVGFTGSTSMMPGLGKCPSGKRGSACRWKAKRKAEEDKKKKAAAAAKKKLEQARLKKEMTQQMNEQLIKLMEAKEAAEAIEVNIPDEPQQLPAIVEEPAPVTTDIPKPVDPSFVAPPVQPLSPPPYQPYLGPTDPTLPVAVTAPPQKNLTKPLLIGGGALAAALLLLS